MSANLSPQTLRRYVLGKQGLWPGRRWQGKEGAAQAVYEMSGVQIDPLTVVARSHDLKLHARVADYKPEYLHDLVYKERRFFDYGNILHYYPMEELPYWKLHMARYHGFGSWAYVEERPELLESVREALRTRGALAQRDLKGNAKVEKNYRSSKDTGVALYYLWARGELMTTGRRGFDRLYDFAENVAPAQYLTPVSEAEAEGFFLRKILRQFVMPRFGEWQHGLYYHLRRKVSAAEVKTLIGELITAGEVTAFRVDGKRGDFYAASADLPILELLEAGGIPAEWAPLGRTTHKEVTFLSPLDPVSARGRAAVLFDFEYTWEIYTPVEKRRWGYYVLPILYGDQLVARVDVKLDRPTKTMLVKGFWLEDPALGKDSAFAAALARGLAHFTRFHEVERLDVSAIQSAKLRAASLFKGSGVSLVRSSE